MPNVTTTLQQHPRASHLGTARRALLSIGTPRVQRWREVASGAVLATLAVATLLASPASAEPAGEAPLPPPDVTFMPSAPPATTTTVDGWMMALSATGETQTAAPALDPAVPSRDIIVGGLFNGTLRGPNGSKAPTPSGSLEVGYQVQCVPAGLLSTLRPSAVTVPVVKEDFTTVDPSATVTAFRVQVDCLGPATVRSYAILTRATSVADSVVAYYGLPRPA
jgi:hypothetical protein